MNSADYNFFDPLRDGEIRLSDSEEQFNTSALLPIPLREFSDASFTGESDSASNSSSLLGTHSERSLSSNTRSRSGESQRCSATSEEEAVGNESRRKRFAAGLTGKRNRVRNGRTQRLGTRLTTNSSSRRQTSTSAAKNRRRHSNSSTPAKFHYRHYHTNFHRRAYYDKFSFLRVVRHWILTMSELTSKYHKEFFLVLFCLASALASLRTGPPKTKTVASPSPFFSPEESGSLIEDLYRGEYVDLARRHIPYHPAFIFYYAHWDSESVESKKELLGVAKYFHLTKPGLLKFYAVNCWWPEGQCRQNYKSLSHYPIFVAHAGSTSGVIYNGPLRAEPMIRFIETVLKPFTRIDTEEELWRFRSQHDAIMLTSFNSTEADFDPSYNTYRQMALRNLEADPFSQVGFGLFLRRDLGEKFYLTSGNTISLVLFNEIHTAKWMAPAKGMKGPVGQVAEWVTEKTSRPPITWSYQVRNGFANKVISLGATDLAQEVTKRPLFLLVTRRYYPSAYSPFYSQIKEVALDYFNCNQSINVTKLRRMTHKLNSEWMKLWKSIYNICQASEPMSASCQVMWEQLRHWDERKGSFTQESLKRYENVVSALGFTGLSCRSARPFRFIAIDPVDVPHFTKLAFGVPVNANPDNGLDGGTNNTFQSDRVKDPIAFIIDAQHELILPFTGFNISEIARTIQNFTTEVESGTFRFPSSLLKSEPDPNFAKQKSIQAFSSHHLMEFLQNDRSTPLFLMYSAPFCGHCTIALTHYVRMAQFLKEYSLEVILGKIDTFSNSLPPNLKPQKIPTFVFFPAHNRSDARVLRPSEPITAQLLLKFLLSELDLRTRVELSLQKSGMGREEGLRRSKQSVMKKIESMLATLSLDPSLKGYHGQVTHSDLLVDLTEEAVDEWKSELMDHLRSMKLSLDVQ